MHQLSTSSIQARTRHWVLNLAWETPRKLSSVIPNVRAEYLNVLEIPAVSATDYAAAFLDLFDSGAIHLIDTNDGEGTSPIRFNLEAVLEARLQLPSQPERDLSRNRPSSITARPKSPDISWQLTPRGGEEWESLAKPRWDRFVDVRTYPNSGEMWSADIDQLMAELGWSRELQRLEIDRDTLTFEILHDYAITYWKLLPTVQHATFQCKWVQHSWRAGTSDPTSLRSWLISRDNWYQKPWDLPNWPNTSR